MDAVKRVHAVPIEVQRPRPERIAEPGLHAGRLAAIGELASGVAHDINNALTPIVAYADLLLETLPNLPAQARRNLQNIRRSGEDIAHIVARLREFYRRRTQDAPLTEVDLNQVMEQVIMLSPGRMNAAGTIPIFTPRSIQMAEQSRVPILK